MANASIMPQLLASASTKAPTIVLTELMHALSLNCPSAAGGGGLLVAETANSSSRPNCCHWTNESSWSRSAC